MSEILRPTVEVTNDGFYYGPNHLTSVFASPQGVGFPYKVDQGFAYKAISATADINGMSTKTLTLSGFRSKTATWDDGLLVLQLAYNAVGTIISNCTAPKIKVEISKNNGDTWSDAFEVRWDSNAGDAGGGLSWMQPVEYLGVGTVWKVNAYPNNPQVNSALHITIPALTDTTQLQIRFTVAGGYIIPQGWPNSPNSPFYVGAGFQVADVFVTDPAYTAPLPGDGGSASDVTLVLKSGDVGVNTRDPKVEFYLTAPPSGQPAGWYDSFVATAPPEWATIPGTNWVDYNGLASQTENATVKARCQFELPEGFSNARLSLSLLSDNVITAVRLNGVVIGSQADNGNDANTRHWITPTTVTTDANFVAGTNTIEFDLKNYLNRSGLDFLGQVVYTPATQGGGGGPVETPVYEIPIVTVGGTAPYTYTILNDSQTTLPLSACEIIAPSTLRISGEGVATGVYTIHLGVTDADGEQDTQIIAVNVLDRTKFNIVTQSFALTSSSLPTTGSKSLLYFGGAGDVIWELLPGVTTLDTATIVGPSLHYTINQYGNYRIGLKATDALGKVATKLINLVATSDSAYRLVDGQLELQFTDEPQILQGSRTFSFTLSDQNSEQVSRTFNYILNPALSGVFPTQYSVNKYWSAADSSPYVLPIKGTINGLTIGDSAPISLPNGLTVTVNGASKSIVFAGNVSNPINALAKVTTPLFRGSALVGEVVRGYMVVPYAGSSLADLGTNSVELPPSMVGSFFTLNPQKPYPNSPDNNRNITWKARVQAGSKLPLGLSLDKNTGLVYGPVVSATNETSVIEFIDPQGTVRGSFALKFNFVRNAFDISGTLAGARTHAAFTGKLIASGTTVSLSRAEVIYGIFPEGLNLSVDGNAVTISGAPLEAGSFDFWLKVTATDGSVGYARRQLEVQMVEPLRVITTTVPPMQTGRAYSYQLQVVGGSRVYTWALATGSTLPTGVTLSDGGLISGTPSDSSFDESLVFEVGDSYGASSSITINVKIDNSLTIVTSSPLPNATKGAPYACIFKASGGSGTGYTWQLDPTSPALPTGLTLDNTGKLAGVTSETAYNQDIVVSLTDSSTLTTTKTFNLTVKAAPVTFSIDSTGVGPIKRGLSYNGTLRVTGAGTAPYRWSSGVLPNGLTLNATPGDQGQTATVSGITSASLLNEVVEVSVTDASGATFVGYMKLTSVSGLTILTQKLPQGRTSADYGAGIVAHGVAPLTYSLKSGTLPSGYVLSSTGRISGTTSTPFTGDITVRVTDGLGDYLERTFSLSVLTSTLSIATTSIPDIPKGQAWEYVMEGSGGVPFNDPLYPYGWRAVAPFAGGNGTSGWRLVITADGSIINNFGGSTGNCGALGNYYITAEGGSGDYTGTGTFPWEVDFPEQPSWSSVIHNYGPIIQVSVTDNVTGQTISGEFQIPVQISGQTVYPVPITFTTVMEGTATAGRVLPTGIALDSRTGRLYGSTNEDFNQDVEFVITDSVGATTTKILKVKTGAGTATGSLKSGIDKVWGTKTNYLGAIGLVPGHPSAIQPRPNKSFMVYGNMPGATISQLSVTASTFDGFYSNLKGAVKSVASDGEVEIELAFTPLDLPGGSLAITLGPTAAQGNTLAVTLTNNATGVVQSTTFNFKTISPGVLRIIDGNGQSLPQRTITPQA